MASESKNLLLVHLISACSRLLSQFGARLRTSNLERKFQANWDEPKHRRKRESKVLPRIHFIGLHLVFTGFHLVFKSQPGLCPSPSLLLQLRNSLLPQTHLRFKKIQVAIFLMPRLSKFSDSWRTSLLRFWVLRCWTDLSAKGSCSRLSFLLFQLPLHLGHFPAKA